MGRLALGLAAVIVSMTPAVALHAALPIAEDELSGYMSAFSNALGSCDIRGFSALLAPNAEFIFPESGGTVRQNRQEYLEGLQELCRYDSPEQGFKAVNSTSEIGGITAKLTFTQTKEYQVGFVRPRRVKATLYQEILVGRSPHDELRATRIYERSDYRDVKTGEHLSREEARPVLPLSRLRRLMGGAQPSPVEDEPPAAK